MMEERSQNRFFGGGKLNDSYVFEEGIYKALALFSERSISVGRL